MAITLVGQAGIAGMLLASPQAISYSSTGENLLVVAGYFNNNSNGASDFPASVTDSTGGVNTWNLSTSNAQTPPTYQNSSGNNINSAFVAWSFTTQAVTSVTIARQDSGEPSTDQWWRVTVAEFSGAAQFGNSWAGLAAGGTTFTLGPVSIGVTGELVVAACIDNSGTLTVPAGWTAFAGSGASVTGYIINPATGSYSPQWSSDTSDFWTGAIAVFSPPSAAPAGNSYTAFMASM